MAKELGLTLNLRKTRILKLSNTNIKWLKRIYKFVKVDNSELVASKNYKNYDVLARLEDKNVWLYSIRIANKSLKFAIRHAKNAVEHVANWELEKSNYCHLHNTHCKFYSTAMAEFNSFKDLANTTTNHGGGLWRRMYKSLKITIAKKVFFDTSKI